MQKRDFKKLLKKVEDLHSDVRWCANDIMGSAETLEGALLSDGMSDEERLNEIISAIENLQKYDLLRAVSLLPDVNDIKDYIDAIKD